MHHRIFNLHIAVVILLTSLSLKSFAIVNVATSDSAGVFRGADDKIHMPLFLSMSYVGLHPYGIESSMNLVVSNDAYNSKWSLIPASAVVSVPLAPQFADAPFRRSRVMLGRQLFVENFDIAILDGVQMPMYWSAKGAVWVYGGNAHLMDLSDPAQAPLVGAHVMNELDSWFLKAGVLARENGLKDIYSYAMMAKSFDGPAWKPNLMVKGEADIKNINHSQFMSQMDFVPSNKFNFYVLYSHRYPKVAKYTDNKTLYQSLSSSAQDTVEQANRFTLTNDVTLHTLLRALQYKGGQEREMGTQEEIRVVWSPDSLRVVEYSLGHIQSYGGFLVDNSVSYGRKVSPTLDWRNEYSLCYLNKVNSISGIAQNLRSGLKWMIMPRLESGLWAELESNHRYKLDTRAMIHVTYFQ